MKKQLIIVGIIVILLTVGLSGCNEQPPKEDPAPTIKFLTATPTTVIFGNSSVLNWFVENATSVSIDNGIGNVIFNGSKTIFPIQNQTYTLTTFNSYGGSNASVKVYVIFISENTSSDEEKIIGTWNFSGKYKNNTLNSSYIFSSNKKFQVITSYIDMVVTQNGTWNIADNKLFIILKGENTITNDYKFSNNNTKLTLTNSTGKIVVFTKQ
ncbi:MAG: hypothetical protein MUO82_09375 [Candidatus Thermoplasmatota archaeon]|nr:hypothetical protein [Candidatus Thermoplasmatota archaeon]